MLTRSTLTIRLHPDDDVVIARAQLVGGTQLADEDVVADLAAVEVDGLDHRHALAEVDVDDAAGAQRGLAHQRPPRREWRGWKRSATSRPVSADS